MIQSYKLISGIKFMSWLHKPTKDYKINKKFKELKEKQKENKQKKGKE